jgi:hypothetical protein
MSLKPDLSIWHGIGTFYLALTGPGLSRVRDIEMEDLRKERFAADI